MHLKHPPAPATWDALRTGPRSPLRRTQGVPQRGSRRPRNRLLSPVPQIPELFKCVWGRTVLGTGCLYTAGAGRNKSLSSHPRAPGLSLRTGKCLCCSAVNLEGVRKRDRPARALTATARPFEQIRRKGPGSPSSPSQEARGARLARPGVPSAVGSPRGVCLRLGNHPSLQG